MAEKQGNHIEKEQSRERRYENVIAYVAGYVRFFFKWLFLAAIIGVICGVLGALFYHGVAWATALRLAHTWLVFLLPAGGLVIVWLYKTLDQVDSNTDTVIIAARDGREVDWRLLPAIFLSTVITHLFGGSSGREGAALQIGGDIGNHVGTAFKANANDLKVLTMCGMAAFFAAVFGTPLGAAIFVVMLMTAGEFLESAILPCYVSSLVSFWVAQALGSERFYFAITAPELRWNYFFQIAALAALCGLVSVVFVELLHRTGHIYKRFFKNEYLRAVVGGCLIIVLTLLVGNSDYNGAGGAIIEAAVMEGETHPYTFLLKMIFTAITLEAGYKGGEIVPTFFVGATFGCFFAPILGLPASFGAAVGLIATFAGATNTLVPSIILGAEIFGGEGLIYIALAVMVAYVVSGYNGLYSSQRIVYAKVRPERVDIMTNRNTMYGRVKARRAGRRTAREEKRSEGKKS